MEHQFIDRPEPLDHAAPPTDYGEQIAALSGKLEALGAASTRQMELFERMLGNMQSRDSAPAKPEPAAPPAWPQEEELERMSRADHSKWLIDQVVKLVGAQVMKPLEEKIGALSQNMNVSRSESILGRLRGSFKDFDEWETEIVKELQAAPGLAPEKAYTIVRSANPEKAKTLDQKYNATPKTPTEEESLLSLIPSRPGTKAGERQFGHLSLDEAVSASFNKFGEPIIAEQNRVAESALLGGGQFTPAP